MTAKATPTIPKDVITVEETAKRTYRSEREIRRLLILGFIQGQKLSGGKKAQWLVYWPSVVECFRKRGIVFPASPVAKG